MTPLPTDTFPTMGEDLDNFAIPDVEAYDGALDQMMWDFGMAMVPMEPPPPAEDGTS